MEKTELNRGERANCWRSDREPNDEGSSSTLWFDLLGSLRPMRFELGIRNGRIQNDF